MGHRGFGLRDFGIRALRYLNFWFWILDCEFRDFSFRYLGHGFRDLGLGIEDLDI